MNGSLARDDCLMMPRQLITISGCVSPRALMTLSKLKAPTRSYLANISGENQRAASSRSRTVP